RIDVARARLLPDRRSLSSDESLRAVEYGAESGLVAGDGRRLLQSLKLGRAVDQRQRHGVGACVEERWRDALVLPLHSVRQSLRLEFGSCVWRGHHNIAHRKSQELSLPWRSH